MNSTFLLQSEKRRKHGGEERKISSSFKSDFFSERESSFLSRIVGDPTVGGLQDKKESCSTRRGLLVGTRFEEFRQTLRGKGYPCLGFILRLSTLLRGRLIGPKP